MTTRPSLSVPTGGALPDAWRAEAASRLNPGEEILAWLETDLDGQLRFSRGLVAVTDRRLLAKAPDQAWQEWAYGRGLVLRHHDHAGVGSLELHDESGRQACWRYTLGQNLAALRLVGRFESQLESRLTGQPVAPPEEALCPTCNSPLEADQEE